MKKKKLRSKNSKIKKSKQIRNPNFTQIISDYNYGPTQDESKKIKKLLNSFVETEEKVNLYKFINNEWKQLLWGRILKGTYNTYKFIFNPLYQTEAYLNFNKDEMPPFDEFLADQYIYREFDPGLENFTYQFTFFPETIFSIVGNNIALNDYDDQFSPVPII